jgi:hypothetical protein
MAWTDNAEAVRKHREAHARRCIDRTGQRVGRLVVTGLSHREKGGMSHWFVRCDCGTAKTVRRCNLETTKSCGCLNAENCAKFAQPGRVAKQKEAARLFAEDTIRRGEKVCTNPTCPVSGPQALSAFHKDATSADGLYDWCQRCKKDKRIRRTFGVSLAYVEALISAQNNKCAACRLDLSNRRPAVDHDHATERVRGVLCGPCNRALGLMHDSPERIEGLLSYAARHAQLAVHAGRKCFA